MFLLEHKRRSTVSDLSEVSLKQARATGTVAVDIETSGLDWKSERIGLCQVFMEDCEPVLIKVKKKGKPDNLLTLLADSSVQKIFHHAMFDLRFICYHWGAQPENIACTKIASKLIQPDHPQGHSLVSLLHRYLNVRIDKSERQSDWLSWDISDSQMAYASSDVMYLPQLLEALETDLRGLGRDDLARKCFRHLPTRTQLEIQGFGDVYEY